MCTHHGCTSSFARRTKLNNHLDQVHGLKVERVQKRYNCPFCKHDPFRTVTLLVGHCEKDHATKLGLYNNYCCLFNCFGHTALVNRKAGAEVQLNDRVPCLERKRGRHNVHELCKGHTRISAEVNRR